MAEEFELRESKEADKGPFQASRADFDTTRRRKALCLKNALTIVERFGMNPVSEEMVAIALPWLEREQYDDIPVERIGYGNCGYPLCPKPASATQFKQQYRISVARRRVYEVGDRKYFCSDWCYRASCYLRRQIPTEPAWCRPLPTGPMLGIKFLPPNAPGRPGKTILDALYHLRLNDDIQNESKKDEFSSSEEEGEGGDMSDKEADTGSSSSELDENVDEVENRRVKQSPIPWNETIPQLTSTELTERRNMAESGAKSSPKQITIERRKVREEVKTTPADIVLARLQEWLTKEAVEVLFNKESCTSAIPQSPSPLLYEKKPLPVVMPLVDSVSQRSYRLRLLVESLLPSLKKILFRLEVPLPSVYEKLQNVVAKFNLTSKNLHLRPHEASLTCLCLLHLLGNDDNLYPHDRLVEMVATFDGASDNAEGFLASIAELACKLHEESLNSPS
ncbi:putative RNA polymerase II subunit B1 CTD phosphatase Rpap2 [Echinococcus granulosus]|uniref:RNA polymerase II subunit B1 CTD phosphatase RPAP2 homolog n=1 Tax=Echinococcus granulosus TaxID=6210 RepID=A0A068WRT2_ECHGR|nr:putative RNA polymerase II subunit B1 CTD phosphatase Rpap2 [Echinococcus granulosus]CDS20337.1 RNA polymerase II subunit B1 CTD phosphatase [Echinococcus granulosus]